MDDGIRDRIILILGILVIMFFVLAVNSCAELQKQKKLKDREIAQRMDLEEKLLKFDQERNDLESKLNKCQKDLEELNSTLENTHKALLQEQLINKSLKEELEKVTKLKEALEEDLKEALVEKKESTKKR